MELNDEQKRWLAELRSGKYPQTIAHVRRIEDNYSYMAGYCCLGVGLDVLDPNGWIDDANYHRLCKMSGADRPVNFLGDEALARLGISDAFQRKLAILNDKNTPFPEIADIIESEIHLQWAYEAIARGEYEQLPPLNDSKRIDP